MMRWCWSRATLVHAMNSHLRRPSRQYATSLRRYLARQHEAVLHEAYELGRRACGRGLGVLDMARLHQAALVSCLAPALRGETVTGALRAAETFFMETLSPFEAAHRGFRKANDELQQSNQALAERNAQLGTMNRRLGLEVAQRKRTERALRESEEHYRVLFHEACGVQENLRRLSNQILHVQEAERKHLSRELHDEVGQALTAVSTTLQVLQRNGGVDPQLLKKRIADAQTLLGQTMDSVHRFARELRPAMLDELGLLPVLRSYLKGFAERTGLRVHLRANAGAEALDAEQKTVLFRVVQESLTNVARHAQATRVITTLRQLDGRVRMEVSDNGKAFNVAQQLASNGKRRLGLLGVQERVRLVNGRLAIKSTHGIGTTVRVDVPLSGAGVSPAARASRPGSHPRGRAARATILTVTPIQTPMPLCKR